MSEVAGRMRCRSERTVRKGAGRHRRAAGGVPGVPAAKVVIGGGVPAPCARMAMVWRLRHVIDKSLPRLYGLDLQFGAQLQRCSRRWRIEREVARDLVIVRC